MDLERALAMFSPALDPEVNAAVLPFNIAHLPR